MASVQYAIDLLNDVLTVRRKSAKFMKEGGYLNSMPLGWPEQCDQLEEALKVLTEAQEHHNHPHSWNDE